MGWVEGVLVPVRMLLLVEESLQKALELVGRQARHSGACEQRKNRCIGY